MFRSCFDHLPSIERSRIGANAPTDIRMHRGERVEPWPRAVQDAIWLSAGSGLIERYLYYPAFIEKLAKFVGTSPDRIVIGAGIEEFIRTLTFLCCDPGDVVASTWPSCAMYDLYPQIFGAVQNRVVTPLNGEWNADKVILQIQGDKRLKLFFLVNPSQPIDVCLPVDEVRKVAAYCHKHDILLAIDEAYYGFGAPTCLPLVKEFDNVLIMRTFSKAFGAASIRVGYVIGQPRVIKPIDAARPSGEISGPSMRVASVLMDMYESHIRPGIQDVCDGRDWLREQFNNNGFNAWGRLSNFVLVDVGNAAQVADGLAQRKFFVRHVPTHPGHLMITCGSVPLMQRFWEAFEEASRAQKAA